jgi:HEPN domain-containing protein
MPTWQTDPDAGPPGEHYGLSQAEEAIRCAREILEFCRLQMA